MDDIDKRHWVSKILLNFNDLRWIMKRPTNVHRNTTLFSSANPGTYRSLFSSDFRQSNLSNSIVLASPHEATPPQSIFLSHNSGILLFALFYLGSIRFALHYIELSFLPHFTLPVYNLPF
jgi:hypothetical protein